MRARWTMAVVLAAAWAAPAEARDVTVGVRGSVSDDADLGLGAEVRWRFLPEDRRLALQASFDYFFPEDPETDFEEFGLGDFAFGDLPFDLDLDAEVEYWEANLNLAWDFTTGGPVIPYAGAGVNYGRARVSVLGFDEDEGDVGANVLAGVRIRDRVFVEAKQEAGGGELFVLTVGVSF